MKTVRKKHSGDQNCSCTSCLYKSESDNSSIRRFMAKGSRIDRLYYGKYIPLRERKLLERLVRTRAVYDDIRAQLISDSTISLSKKVDSKPKKKFSSKELDDVEKGSGAIFELVDLVDKGATLGLSECCSCCSCSSEINLQDHARHMQHRPHSGSSRKGIKKDRLDANRKKKGVHFKVKHIRSDPCTCTFKLSELLKKKKQNIPNEPFDLQFISNEKRKPKQKRVRELARRSYENIKQTNKQIGEKVLDGIKRVKESKTHIEEKLKLDVQASAVNLKKTTNVLKSKMKSNPPKKLSKLKLNDLLAICMCPEDEVFEKPAKGSFEIIKQKSIEKMIEAKNKLKSVMKSNSPKKLSKLQLNELLAICMCPEDELIEKPAKGSPLDIVKQKSREKMIEAKNKLKSVMKSNPTKKLSKLQLNELLAICMCPEDKLIEKPAKGSPLEIVKQKSREKMIEAKNKLKSVMKSTIDRKPKSTKIKSINSGTYIASEKDIAYKIKKDSIRKFKEELIRKQIMKDWECDPECIEDICDPEECYIKLKRKRKNMKHRGIEHHIRKHEKVSGTELSLKNVKIQNKVLPEEAPKKTGKKQTDKKKDVKIIPKEKSTAKIKKGLHVTTSFSINLQLYKEELPTKPAETDLKEPAIAKQTPSGINYKINKNPKVNRNQRTSQLAIKRSSKNSQTEIRSLKRCFCTLKLKSKRSKAKHKKKYNLKTAEKSVETLGPPVAPCKHSNCSVQMCDKLICEKLMLKKLSNVHTNTSNDNKVKKKKDIKTRQLLPYECEPGICTPGDCDPYDCIKLINIREAKVKNNSISCLCPSRKTKSTSTLTSRSPSSKAKFAQSLYTYGAPQNRKEGKAKREKKNVRNPYARPAIQIIRPAVERGRQPLEIGRQAVRIGSTFSFNIEFYKNKPPQYYSQPPPDLKTFSVNPKLKAVTKPKLKERGYQGDVASIYKNIQTHKNKKDTSMSTLKRCFCTLKLQKKSHSKIKKKRMFSTGTKTMEEPVTNIKTFTKGTKTKQKYLNSLKPYECEPFTCIPGECNPYECLERINRRNLRDVGVSSTFNRSEINKGSSTSDKSLKDVKTQSKPKQRQQKVLSKVKKSKKQTKNLKEYSDYTSSAPSKQTVRIGSTFSFNIEFYKNKSRKNALKDNYLKRPAVKLDSRPVTKNKGIKIVKLNVANLDTQVEEIKKLNKISGTKPILKRCFCTLNLQKKKNNAIIDPLRPSALQRNQFIVNRAMMKENRLSIYRTHCSRNICLSKTTNIDMNNSISDQSSNCVIQSLFNECKRFSSIQYLESQSCHPLITNKFETIKSNLNTAERLISEAYINNNLIINKMGRSHQERKCVVYNENNNNAEQRNLTGLTQLLKGYYCTMNLQVVKNRISIGKQKNIDTAVGKNDSNSPRKLKPYECEPGVCVPGECDPYECLKLISKRDSNFSKKIGTENTVTSSSSYTNNTPKYKSYKVQSPSQKPTKPQVSRVYQTQNKSGEKNAVRVGSSFSFDIEFFKKSASPQVVEKKRKTRTKSNSSKITKMNKQSFRSRYSQSAFNKTLQKASATLPRMKRCFCTLKLQKKGRLQKTVHKQPSEALQTDGIFPESTTVDKGQNAPKFKPLKIAQSLKPYECKPGICTPGQCNPYECLEIMKKLNYNQTADLGTYAKIGDSKSTGSMTVSDRKYKTRPVNVKPKVIRTKTVSEGKTRQRRTVQPTDLVNPAKQVVRIGSSFSFDIEFHKSHPSLEYTRSYIPEKASRMIDNKVSDLKKQATKMKQRSSETSKRIRHTQSQIKSSVQAASTMTTSFMKRCFCVLKLKKNKNKNIKKVEANIVKTIEKPVNIDKKTNTKPFKERILQLEPYECEPGICIPGQCDPHQCLKLIKRRNNLRSQSSSTAYTSTKSASSSIRKTDQKNINTQLRPKKTTKETKKQVYTKRKVNDSNRQVVKIGSKFSFDVEFYKDHTSKLKNVVPKEKTKSISYSEQKKKKQKNSGAKSHSVSFTSKESQMKMNKKDFGAGINNIIKRCFCTLQLQHSRKQNKTKEAKQKPVKNEVHSKSVMTTEKQNNLNSLLPYECEPNVCVPNECDPYECEKLIKLRQHRHREVGMSTQHMSKQSAASLTEPFKKSKKRTQSISYKNKESIKYVKGPKRIQEAQSKQCVKIGSSFSFDIEFFKNKGPGLQFDQKPHYIQPKLSVPKLKKVRTKDQVLQSRKPLQASPSQVGTEVMKTQSTMARLTPPLKRCFCTLIFKKNKKEPVIIRKPETTSVGTEAKLRVPKLEPVAKLLPYECEPNICIPGECNPIECLERIKARMKQQKNFGTSTPYSQKREIGNTVGTNKTSSKRSQFKSSGHVQKRRHMRPIQTQNTNKQVVRIGSNFSFNIDFYKQRGLDNIDQKVSNDHKSKYISKPLHTTNNKKKVVKIEKQVCQPYCHKLDSKIQRDRGIQSSHIKQSSKSSAVQPFLKRCFCTLKFQKNPAQKNLKTVSKSDDKKNIQKISKPKVVSFDKGTLTKKYKNKIDLAAYECEPLTCIPGQCDPNECLKRIEARNRKSKNISTQMLKQSTQKGVGINLAKLNSKKIQSKISSHSPSKDQVKSSQSKVRKQSNIVEVPRFGNLFNKQGVRIGSNVSVNIEFYKEILTPDKMYPKCEKIKCYEETTPKKPKRHSDAITNHKVLKNHNKGIQGDIVKTDSKALEVGNALKRCFCTLKLQKDLNTKLSKANIQNPQFPQIIEVRRVGVKNKRNKDTKQTFTEVKSVGTKTKTKYLNSESAVCDPNTCKNFKYLRPEELEVIHPYMPNKFNKTPSKTLHNKEFFNKTNQKPRKTKITDRGKRLTKKKSRNHIHKNNHQIEDLNVSNHSLSNLQKMVCRCAQLFSHKTPYVDNTVYQQSIDQNTTKSDRLSHHGDSEQKSNKSKHSKKCNENCPYTQTRYQDGDTVPTMSLKIIKKNQNNPDAMSQKKKNVVKKSERQKDIENKNQEASGNGMENFFCSHCKNDKMNKHHSQPLKVHFIDTPIIKSKDVGKRTKARDGLGHLNKSVDQIDKRKVSMQRNSNKNDMQERKLAKYCNYCTTCGAKLNNEEIKKAAGDQKSTKSVLKEKAPILQQITSDRIKNLFKFKQSVDNICSSKAPEPPLFEMHLDSDDYEIINKEEVYDKVTKLRKKSIKNIPKDKILHGKSCRCCICLAKRNKTGAAFNISPKGSMVGGTFGKFFGRSPSSPTGKPCVCGSKVCSEKLALMNKEFRSHKKIHHKRSCDCGSPICAAEREMMSAISSGKNKVTCICALEKAKESKRKNKLENKKRAKRLKMHQHDDKIRNKNRRRADKIMEKKINKNSSDFVLMAESLIDIGKFGVTACTDILRLVARTVVDPKEAYTKLKDIKHDPNLLYEYMKSGVRNTGAASTAKRVRLRCLSMRGVKKVKNTLERYPLTNYLLYIAHKDPKKRIAKRRPREREQLDFNCSLYMGSLRKKPSLWVYNRCPWFYPHFMSLVNVWKQFIDIALFLLAVVVWSPCIFCMEACRAIMCCFFCTG